VGGYEIPNRQIIARSTELASKSKQVPLTPGKRIRSTLQNWEVGAAEENDARA
jgi:hypothetical protein